MYCKFLDEMYKNELSMMNNNIYIRKEVGRQRIQKFNTQNHFGLVFSSETLVFFVVQPLYIKFFNYNSLPSFW